MRGLVLLVAGAAVAVTFVATSSGSGQTLKACVLVNHADAARVLHKPIGISQHQVLGPYDSCAYGSTDHLSHVSIQTRPLSRADFMKSVNANPGPHRRVSGVGTVAYYVGSLPTLLMWKNNNEVNSLAVGVPNAATTEKLALQAAARRIH